MVAFCMSRSQRASVWRMGWKITLDQFQRGRVAFEKRVLGEVDVAHLSAAELFAKLIVTDTVGALDVTDEAVQHRGRNDRHSGTED